MYVYDYSFISDFFSSSIYLESCSGIIILQNKYKCSITLVAYVIFAILSWPFAGLCWSVLCSSHSSRIILLTLVKSDWNSSIFMFFFYCDLLGFSILSSSDFRCSSCYFFTFCWYVYRFCIDLQCFEYLPLNKLSHPVFFILLVIFYINLCFLFHSQHI